MDHEKALWEAFQTQLNRLEGKLDTLLDSHLSFKGKIIGGAMVVSALTSLVVEWVRK